MAVVISGVNNNDKITATDGKIDLLSGVNFSGEVEVPSFKVGSNIQFGNAGIITATTLVGNVQGNINHTSNLLLQISGSEKFRVGTSGQLGIGGANYGTSGQVLTSGGSGSAATWSTIPTPDADKIIEGNTKAEVVDTGSNGYFKVETEGAERLRITSTGVVGINSDASGNGSGSKLVVGGRIQSNSGGYWIADSNGAENGWHIQDSSGDLMIVESGVAERVRIDSSGNVHINNTNNLKKFSVREGSSSSGVYYNAHIGGASHLANYAVGIGFDPEGYPARTKIGIVAEGTSTGYSRGKLHFLLDSANDSGEATLSESRMTITDSGKVGINSTTPFQTLDVRGSINGGSENQPFQRFHDSHGNQRTTKHYFRCTKGGTSIFDITTVDLNTNFHQALIIIYYGARIQAVADSNTYPVHKIIGVNRFNGGSIQFDKQVIQQNGNVQTHADIDAVATSSTNYRVRLTFSGTAGGSSFAAGYVEIIGLGPGTDGAFYSLAHGYGITR